MKKLLRTLVVAAALAPATLAAQSNDAPSNAAEERATSFEAVTGAQREDVPGGPLLVGAYALVWLFTMGYVLRLGKLEATLASDVERLARDVAAAKAKQA